MSQLDESFSHVETGDDFIDSFQLPVRWLNSHVEHSRRISDPRRGIRNVLQIERWSRQREIGRGGFGNVYLEKTEGGQLRAVKEVPKISGRIQTIDYLREILAMAHFRKEEALFVKLEGWYQNEQYIHIAMEYFPNGDLSDCVTLPLLEQEVQTITYQVAEALDFMHGKNFTHRDIKPSNIFVVSSSPNWWIKLGDFGVSKRVKNDSTSMHTSIETDYTAPEIRGFVVVEDETSSYTSAVDIWSLGCLCHWLLCQQLPLTIREMLPYCMGKLELPTKHLNTYQVSGEAIEFIKQLLRSQPEKRLSASEALNHNWTKEPNFSELDREHDEQKTQEIHTIAQNPGKRKEFLSLPCTALNTLEGHKHSVGDVTFSPDGRMLASASDDKTVRLWDSRSGAALGTLKGHRNLVSAVAFSPDSKILASASRDKTVRLWDSQSRILLKTLEGHEGNVEAVAFSPDGEILASASRDRTIRLWDSQSRTLLQTLEGHEYFMTVAFSPDGEILAWTSLDNTVMLWDIQSRTLLKTLEGHKKVVTAVAFSPDGEILASASQDGTVILWDSQSRTVLKTLENHKGGVGAVGFSPDSKILASASSDMTIKLWDSKSGILLKTLEGHEKGVIAVDFSPDGRMLASASHDKTVRLWGSWL